MKKPSFSFIVSSYNYGSYLGECLNSLVKQSYDSNDFEIICVDDGSPDNSVSIIQEFLSRFPNIRLFQTNRLGIEKVCNTGIRAAKFSYIVRVDADDFLDTNFLDVMSKAIQTNPEFSFYYPKSYILFSTSGESVVKELPDFDASEIFERGDFLATGTAYLRSALDEINLYPEQHPNCGLENYSVILQLLSRKHQGLAVGGTKLHYRRHQKNLSVTQIKSIVNFGEELLVNYGRHYQTNRNHPYGLANAEVLKYRNSLELK